MKPFARIAPRLGYVASVGLVLLSTFGCAEDLNGVPWYAALSSFHFPHLYSVDLDEDTFQPAIRNSTSEHILVEFYAPWCPHCQHFAPEYERLALTIDRSQHLALGAKLSASHTSLAKPGILSATVDCLRHASLCQSWGIDSFPTLLWGRKVDWLSDSRQHLSEVAVTEATAEAVAHWIDNETHIHIDPSQVSRQELFKLVHWSNRVSTDSHVSASAASSSSSQISAKADAWDVQVATALFLHNAFAQLTSDSFSDTDLDKKIGALSDFIALLTDRFPETANSGTPCRDSLAALGNRLKGNGSAFQKTATPLQAEGDGNIILANMDPDTMESEWRFCGMEWDTLGERGWRSCRGTWPGKRGFTCGLWTMFHMLAARAGDRDAGRELHVLRTVVSEFFDCEECRKHFETIPVTAADVRTKRAVQLWWWTTHNAVNLRVKSFEDQFEDGDPAYPKVQWPTLSQCPDCRRLKQDSKPRSVFLSLPRAGHQVKPELKNSSWDLDAVASFLTHFYGA